MLTKRPTHIEGEGFVEYRRRVDTWQIANGEKCYRCKRMATFLNPPGRRNLCCECECIEDNRLIEETP